MAKHRDRSFIPNCPACIAMRQHVVSEWLDFHPLAGHGFSDRWSSAEALKAHDQDSEAAKPVPPPETT
jgi:hypothetical protein